MSDSAMLPLAPAGYLHQLPTLLRGQTEAITAWLDEREWRRTAMHLAIIIIGAGLYGAAMGCSRSPLQAVFVAVKFPLVILLTTLGNALLNGLLAPLLGVNLSLRRSLQLVLMSFVIASLVLGAFSPVMAFWAWNSPRLDKTTSAAASAHTLLILAHVAVIAFAGIAANLRLARLLERLAGDLHSGRRVLLAWLAGNLFLGSQLVWVLRPFIGTPWLPVEFLRSDAFRGNFYEAVFRSFLRQFN